MSQAQETIVLTTFVGSLDEKRAELSAQLRFATVGASECYKALDRLNALIHDYASVVDEADRALLEEVAERVAHRLNVFEDQKENARNTWEALKAHSALSAA